MPQYRNNGREEIVKVVTLDSDKANRYRQETRRLNRLNDRLPELIAALLDEESERQQEQWDCLAREAGFTNMTDVDAQGVSLVMDYVAGTITVLKKKDDE